MEVGATAEECGGRVGEKNSAVLLHDCLASLLDTSTALLRPEEHDVYVAL